VNTLLYSDPRFNVDDTLVQEKFNLVFNVSLTVNLSSTREKSDSAIM